MKMKKLLAIVLVLCMAVGLAACAATVGSDNQSNNQNAQQSTNDSTGNNGSTTVAETGDTYIIGCPQPLTSTNAQPGECALNAVLNPSLRTRSLQSSAALTKKRFLRLHRHSMKAA